MKQEKAAIKRLKSLPNLFRTQDAEKVSPHTGMFLSRALQNGLIHRLTRGNYINSFLYGFPRIEEVACFLKPPAYISCEWALNYHGISLQSPLMCTVITLSTAVGKKRNVDYRGITIEFSRISPSLFTGFFYYERFYMASPEKAILDTIYYRRSIPAQDELNLDEIDSKKLLKLLDKYPPYVSKILLSLNGSNAFDFGAA
jgi:predicted transcriptional regulator of viral defense system